MTLDIAKVDSIFMITKYKPKWNPGGKGSEEREVPGAKFKEATTSRLCMIKPCTRNPRCVDTFLFCILNQQVPS
jgi:hypothetical protein